MSYCLFATLSLASGQNIRCEHNKNDIEQVTCDKTEFAYVW